MFIGVGLVRQLGGSGRQRAGGRRPPTHLLPGPRRPAAGPARRSSCPNVAQESPGRHPCDTENMPAGAPAPGPLPAPNSPASLSEGSGGCGLPPLLPQVAPASPTHLVAGGACSVRAGCGLERIRTKWFNAGEVLVGAPAPCSARNCPPPAAWRGGRSAATSWDPLCVLLAMPQLQRVCS